MLLVMFAYMALALLGLSNPIRAYDSGHLASETLHLPEDSPAASIVHEHAFHVSGPSQPPVYAERGIWPRPEQRIDSLQHPSPPQAIAILASWLGQLAADPGPYADPAIEWSEVQQPGTIFPRCHRSVVLHL